ncbi:MAG TPA: tetratricopeptide repeat protein [Pyrinomonadaceae bacterium]|jgi:tetratricopeptide (TPR) repeat protein
MRRASNFCLTLLLLLACATHIRAQEEYLPELVRRVKPSVVAIVTYDARGEKLSKGSGFFIASDRVVTNRHVIDGAFKAEIHTTTGNTYNVRGVLAVDGAGDIALLQIDIAANIINPLTITRTSPQEGESVVVVGNPLGLEGSVSNGIVSAVRDIPNFGRIIQITAPISTGSSGSPVINMQGQVIGVATLQLTDGQSLNFAVPSDRVSALQTTALRTLSEVVSATKKSQRATAERFYMQGLGFLSRDDCEKALPYFKRAVDSDPTYAEAWAQTGFCNGILGRHEEALKASRQAIRLRPDSAESYVNIGSAYAYLGQYKESAEAYRQALRLEPDNYEVHYALGLTYNKMGRADDELQSYKQAIRLKPDYAAAYERLGLAYMRMNRHTEAVAAFKQLVMLKPGDAAAYDNLGLAHLKAKQVADGIEAFKQAIQLKPDFARAYYNLGLGYLAIDNRDAALEQYTILKGLDPDRANKLFSMIYP